MLAHTVFSVQMAWAGDLTAISSRFVAASNEGNIEKLASTLWDSGTAKDKFLTEFKEVAPEFQKRKLWFTKIERELVIGELGTTLVRLDSEGDSHSDYERIVCLKVHGEWLIYPWATEEDLKVLSNQRSKEEQIHLKLFKEWSRLMEKLLAEEAAQPGAAQPATQPADKVPSKNQPSTPTSEDAPR
jgi:hypothetical protein